MRIRRNQCWQAAQGLLIRRKFHKQIVFSVWDDTESPRVPWEWRSGPWREGWRGGWRRGRWWPWERPVVWRSDVSDLASRARWVAGTPRCWLRSTCWGNSTPVCHYKGAASQERLTDCLGFVPRALTMSPPAGSDICHIRQSEKYYLTTCETTMGR